MLNSPSFVTILIHETRNLANLPESPRQRKAKLAFFAAAANKARRAETHPSF
jgi:hypothetical protein